MFDKEFDGRGGETATGVAVAPDDGTVYVAGTTTSFGAGSHDAFVLHLVPTGKKLLDAFTWGGTGFEEGSGVGVIAGRVALSATTTNPPPYSLLAASARLSAARGDACDQCGSRDYTRGHLCGSGCGRNNTEREYNLRRRLRGSPREDRSVTFPVSSERFSDERRRSWQSSLDASPAMFGHRLRTNGNCVLGSLTSKTTITFIHRARICGFLERPTLRLL